MKKYMNISARSMKPIDLHLVSWNRPKMTKLVIETIHRNTNPENFRLVVVDNGSDNETVDMLTELADNGMIDELHLWPKNKGLEEARQFMLFHATDSSYFICVDNDCLPPPMVDGIDWIDRLLDLMGKYESFAAISCRTQVMIGTGNIFEEADQVGDELVEFPHPGGSLRIMSTGATRQVGGWDAKRPGRGAEERYICGQLREAGYRTAFAVQIRTLHLFGTRGDNGTDRWGYQAGLEPQDTGHNDVSHPALTNGDDFEEVSLYAGYDNTIKYFE